MNAKGTRITIITVAAVIIFAATIFLHCFLISEGDYQVARTVEHDYSLPHVAIGEVLFHAETFGHDTCQAVIVLHDGPGHDYRSLLYLKELADEYQVIFYDRRGTGLSPRVKIEELSPENMLHDLLGVKRHYAGDEPVRLVAHSWAAELAKLFSMSYPEQVVKVAILSPRSSSNDTNRGFYNLRDLGMCWFKSLHVREPDPQAARDYFYTSKANYLFSVEVEETSRSFWRYSAMAVKAFRGMTFVEANLDQLPIHSHVIPGDEPEKNLAAIRDYLNSQ